VKCEDRLVGKGCVIYADGMLYCYGENGTVALVKPRSTRYELVSSFEITKGTDEHWAHPAVSHGRLYIRHGDALMVYDIKAKGGPTGRSAEWRRAPIMRCSQVY
jgi:hypothetical protein